MICVGLEKQFEIWNFIEKGGFGSIYLAHDKMNNFRKVAVKSMHKNVIIKSDRVSLIK